MLPANLEIKSTTDGLNAMTRQHFFPINPFPQTLLPRFSFPRWSDWDYFHVVFMHDGIMGAGLGDDP